MIMAWIRSMLGPFGVIMDFFAAHPEILTAILAVWMLLYVAGRIQLKLIEQRTAQLVIERTRRLIAADPAISFAALREKILPEWQEACQGWNYKFVPHKFEFWPVPATPKNVLVKLPLGPEWFATVLKTNGINLKDMPVEAATKRSK